MKSIEEIKEEYSYFSNKRGLEMIERQRENKESKFFFKDKEQYYTLCCDTPQENRLLISKLEVL